MLAVCSAVQAQKEQQNATQTTSTSKATQNRPERAQACCTPMVLTEMGRLHPVPTQPSQPHKLHASVLIMRHGTACTQVVYCPSSYRPATTSKHTLV